MKDFTFLNVAITISAKDANEAYSKLCDMVAEFNALHRTHSDMRDVVEYATDTYVSNDDMDCVERSTTELMPK